MAAKQPGGVFGGMGVANFNNGTDACVITTDIPAAGYTGGQNYTVTVTSTGTFAQKVTCSSGMFGDDDTSNQPTKARSDSYLDCSNKWCSCLFRCHGQNPSSWEEVDWWEPLGFSEERDLKAWVKGVHVHLPQAQSWLRIKPRCPVLGMGFIK
ncbi:unnamed protein product [Durusdinium trenchii]